MKNAHPLGTGLAAPFSLTVGGRLGLVSDQAHVAQSLRLILGTRLGERRMRPDFGCALHDYFFAPNTAYTRARIQQAVEQAVTALEPRIEQLEVRVVPDAHAPERINIHLRYRLRNALQPDAMVVPVDLQQP